MPKMIKFVVYEQVMFLIKVKTRIDLSYWYTDTLTHKCFFNPYKETNSKFWHYAEAFTFRLE